MKHPHLHTAIRCVARFQDDESRLQQILRYTNYNHAEAEALLEAAKAEHHLRRTKSLGFVRTLVLGMKTFGVVASLLQVVLGVGLIGFGLWLATSESPSWGLVAVLETIGIAALFSAREQWANARGPAALQT